MKTIKKRLRGQAKNKYRNLSEEDKNKKREYARNRYHNVTKGKKKKTKIISKKLRWDQKIKIKKLTLFLFTVKNTEQEAVYFGENGIIKNVFHKNKRPININEVDIEEIVLSHE